MGLLQLLFILVIFGVILYCINRFVPMDGKIKNIINSDDVVAIVLWLISIFIPGLFTGFSDIKVK